MDQQPDRGGLTCAIEMSFSPASLDQALQLLLSAVGPTEARADCRECSVDGDDATSGLVRFVTVWSGESGFQAHVQSEVFRRVLVAMDLCCEEPRVSIGTLAGSAGMAYLRALRGDPGDDAGGR